MGGTVATCAAGQSRSSVVTVGHSAAREALDRAVAGYCSATPGSAALYRKASARLPAGVTSNVKFFPPYPVYLTRADGSHVVDVDGREYIDYCLAFGPLICGHGHPRVMAAVKSELARAGTTIFGAPGDLELRLAERIAALVPSAEMTRFTSSGTEAIPHALRAARGATGAVAIARGPPRRPRSRAVEPGSAAAAEARDRRHPRRDRRADASCRSAIPTPCARLSRRVRYCGRNIEPVSRGSSIQSARFAGAARSPTRHGAVLVFDEVVAWPVGSAAPRGSTASRPI